MIRMKPCEDCNVPSRFTIPLPTANTYHFPGHTGEEEDQRMAERISVDHPAMMKRKRTYKLVKYTFEFLSIFIAVISAFALNNWNDNRRDRLAENKILTEIYNGRRMT